MGSFIKTVSKFGAQDFFIYQKNDSSSKLISLLGVVPAMGANIIDLAMKGAYVIDGHMDAVSLQTRHAYKSEILAPFPNRLDSGAFSYEGKEHTFPINDLEYGNALHGFMNDAKFEIIEEELSENLFLKLKHKYDQRHAYFSFKFELIVSYLLSDDKFIIDFEIVNCGASRLPIGLGWHPYFLINQDETIIDSCLLEEIVTNEKMIPSGALKNVKFESQRLKNLVLDTTYRIGDSIEGLILKLNRKLEPSKILTLSFFNEQDKTAFEYLQLYHPPNARSFAVEPMTCNVNALNNKEGLLELESGTVKKFRFRIEADLIHA